jgi:hypothetical protein
MAQLVTRDIVLESLKKLPENATLDDIIEHVVFMAKLEEALVQSEARELVAHQDVLARFSK